MLNPIFFSCHIQQLQPESDKTQTNLQTQPQSNDPDTRNDFLISRWHIRTCLHVRNEILEDAKMNDLYLLNPFVMS